MSRLLEELVGSVWQFEDRRHRTSGPLFLVVDVRPNRDPDPDVIALDCSTGETTYGYYDPFQRPGDPEWEVLIVYNTKIEGVVLGSQYLVPYAA